jgi:hypothetical protein
VCPNTFAKSQSINDWLAYFANDSIQIFHSSDFLSNESANILLELEDETITDFNQALSKLSLTLIEIDNSTFVLNPIQHKDNPTTGIIIKAVDATNQKQINQFSVSLDHNNLKTKKSVVIINDLTTNTIFFKVSASGYKVISNEVDLIEGKYNTITLQLKPLPKRLDKVIVTASRVDFRLLDSVNKSFLREDIENTVSFNNDPLRAQQNIAGNANTGISGKTKTRGGNDNESLIVLDGHVLRNPYHFKNFFSLFSTINQSIVETLDFYSGVFPIQYGGKLSSVVNINSDDNVGLQTHEIGANLLNAYYTYRHSNNDFSRQYLFSVRTGGQLINKNLTESNILPEYDDAYIKTFQKLNDNWQSSQHLLLSRDEISILDLDDESIGEVAEAGYHDQDLWLQWQYDNHENIVANFQFYSSRTHNNRTGMVNTDDTIASLNEDILTKYSGIKFDQIFNVNDQLSLSYGINLFNEDTRIKSNRNINHFGELATELNLQRQTHQDFEFNKDGNGMDIFFNSRYQFNDKIIFDFGLRYEDKQWISKKLISPRFNLSYFYNDSTTYRLALGRHQQSQHIDEFLLEDENPSYFDPTSVDIAIIELNKSLTSTLSLRAEIYYKKYNSTQPYYENLFNEFHVLPDLFFDRVRITADESKASGAEFTLNGRHRKFDWSASYIVSDTFDIVDGVETPRSWDQHNAIKANLHMPINAKYLNKWILDVTANYHNGWAKTTLEQTEDGLQIGARNQNTFSDFYQVDVKLSKDIKLHRGNLKLSFQVNNLINNNNPCCVDYDLEDGTLKSKQKSWLPLLPNINVVYNWN